MYSVGNIVIYTLYCICTITEETERFFNGANTKYFVLVPLSDTKTKITVPAENPITLSRIHSLLPSNEIEAIIEEIPFLETIWIDNDNQRKKEFGDIIKAGNRKEILQMMKSIYTHALGLKNKGRKLHVSDEQCMRDGEKLILDEFSYVLGRDRILLADEIQNKFNA